MGLGADSKLTSLTPPLDAGMLASSPSGALAEPGTPGATFLGGAGVRFSNESSRGTLEGSTIGTDGVSATEGAGALARPPGFLSSSLPSSCAWR